MKYNMLIATAGTIAFHMTGALFLPALYTNNTANTAMMSVQQTVQYTQATHTPVQKTRVKPAPVSTAKTESNAIRTPKPISELIPELAPKLESEPIPELAPELEPETAPVLEKIKMPEVASDSPDKQNAQPVVKAQGVSTNKPPVYPRMALLRKQSGTVLLRVHILATGRVNAVEIIQSSGYALLDNAAKTGIADWQFSPERRNNKPVDSWSELPIRFTLLSKKS